MKKLIYRFGFFGLITLTYFTTRLVALTRLPVFADEAIYVRWAQVMRSVETLRFLPLTDGKQPLFMWLVIPLLKFFTDPLVAGRMLSVMAGFATLVTLCMTVSLVINWVKVKTIPTDFRYLFQPTSWFVAALLYCFSTFTFFFDRMALADTLLSFFGILALGLSLLQAKFLRLDLALILGVVLGFAWLTKSPAIYFVCLSAFTVIFLNLNRLTFNCKLIIKNWQLYLYPLLSTILAFGIYNTLRLGPQFHMIALRNKDYIWSLGEILTHPFDPLKPHLGDIFSWFTSYLPWVLILISVVYLLFLAVKKRQAITKLRPLSVVFLWFLLPLIANAVLAKTFTARYILFTIPPLLVLIGTLLSTLIMSLTIAKKVVFWLCVFIVLTPQFLFMYRLATSPEELTLPSTEMGYLQDWTAGWGIKASADYLRDRAKVVNVIAGTEGYFGTLPDGLQIYTEGVPQLTVIGVGLGLREIPPNLTEARAAGDEVYILGNASRFSLSTEAHSNLETVLSFPKPDGDTFYLYKLK